MKKSDIAVIILIASLSVGVAYFVGDLVIGKPKGGETKVRTVESISGEITSPDAKIFNKDAINPTVEVVIGGN